MNAGDLKAWRWFANTETIWKTNRTEKNKKIGASDYLNWMNKLTDQNLNIRYFFYAELLKFIENILVF